MIKLHENTDKKFVFCAKYNLTAAGHKLYFFVFSYISEYSVSLSDVLVNSVYTLKTTTTKT